jgi:DNA-binding MarR family transcriptional regulator
MSEKELDLATIDKAHCLEMGMTCACFNLRRASRLVTQIFDDTLRPTGLKTTQFSLLVAAHIQRKQVLSKLAKLMGMDRTTLSRNLKLLEKKGLVKLGRGEDRREVLVSLSEKGEQALAEATPLWKKAQERVTGGVGQEKWHAMIDDLRALGKSLK